MGTHPDICLMIVSCIKSAADLLQLARFWLCTLVQTEFICYNIIVNSVSFVSTGTFNNVFPSLPMHTVLSSKFPREI
jgi:hypothetical protein